MPPPPEQITTALSPTSTRIIASSTITRGSGEGTTRRHAVPSSRTCQPALGRQALGDRPGVHRADELGRVRERRVVDVHLGLADEAHDVPAGEGVLERLEEEVADHPLGLGAQDIQGIGTGEHGIGGALVGQEAHLGAVAVGDDELVVGRQTGQGGDGHGHVALLDLGDRDLALLEERIATDRHHQPHLGYPGTAAAQAGVDASTSATAAPVTSSGRSTGSADSPRRWRRAFRKA